MFCFSVILGALNLIAFVKYYCIQKSKLKLEKGFVKVHDTINIEQCRIVVKTYGKSAILMKRTQSYPFSYESYLHLLLSLPWIIHLHLYCLIKSNL